MHCRVFYLHVNLVWMGLFQHLSGFSIIRTTTSRTRTRTAPTLIESVSVSNQYGIQQQNFERHFSSSTLHAIVHEKHRHETTTASSSSSTVSDRLKFEQSLLNGLNPSQITAITQPLSSITRVIAGPGSGKTRVLTSRIAYLLANDRRSNILAVTFTKKAASEMEKRVLDIVGETMRQRVSLGTFHSICTRILRHNGERLKTLPSVVADMAKSENATVLDGSFTILDQSDQVRLIKEVLELHKLDLASYRDVKPLNVINAMGRIKAELAMGNSNPFAKKDKRSPPDPPAIEIAKTIHFSFRESLLAKNCLDFDDLILLSRELLLNHPDVKDRLRSFWTHVLVDEFQDTSESQMDLVKLLTSNSLLVVGDADQSIYSWRGAKATSLADFGNEFESVQTVHLMENYRSTANIVRAAQMVISDSGQVSGADKLRQEMIPKRGNGVAPRILSCADGKAEGKKLSKDSLPGTFLTCIYPLILQLNLLSIM
jgi:DNA helicase II / ATP-dependent DNA helicase PcrA